MVETLFGGTAPRRLTPSYIFLSLNLLMLAFFMLLTSLSVTEKRRAEAAVGSLRQTFAEQQGADVRELSNSDSTGLFRARERFFTAVRASYEQTVALGDYAPVQIGNVMQVTLPIDALFKRNRAALHAIVDPFLSGIAAALSAAEAGIRLEAELLVASGEALPTVDLASDLALRRADYFARALRAEGAPAESILVGLLPASSDRVVISFRARLVEQAQIRFNAVPQSEN